VDTFETILAQCTAFLENAPPPSNEKGRQETIPRFASDGQGTSPYIPGSGVVAGHEYGYTSQADVGVQGDTGRLVLVDEHDGRIVGELSEGFNVLEQGNVEPGSKAPVEITLPTKPGNLDVIVEPVQPITDDYLDAASHPAYASSSLVSKAATASKMVVTAATYVASAMETGAQKFTQSTQPVNQPLSFTPATHDRVRKIHSFTQGATSVSSKTVGRAQHIMQNLGAKVAGKDQREAAGKGAGKPGLLNKSMIAFSTIADGIDAASKHLLASGGNAATTMVGHRYGNEAKGLAYDLTSSVRNVGLVYVDATGVSRKAVIKSVAKGMVLGSVKGGGKVVVTSDNGSHGEIIYPHDEKSLSSGLGTSTPQNKPVSPTPTPPPYALPGGSDYASTMNTARSEKRGL